MSAKLQKPLTHFFARRDPVEVQQEQDASHAAHLAHAEEQKALARQKQEEATVHVAEGTPAGSESDEDSPEKATPFLHVIVELSSATGYTTS